MTYYPHRRLDSFRPIDPDASQAGNLAASSLIANIAQKQDAMHLGCLGNSHSWFYPDPRYAPEIAVSALDTYYRFYMDAATTYFKLPWHIQIGFGGPIACRIVLAISTVNHDLIIKSTTEPLVAGGATQDSGDIVVPHSWLPAPRGMWRRDTPQWWLASVVVPVELPTIPADRLIDVGFSAKVIELGDPLYTTWSTAVKIYSLTLEDTEA